MSTDDRSPRRSEDGDHVRTVSERDDADGMADVVIADNGPGLPEDERVAIE